MGAKSTIFGVVVAVAGRGGGGSGGGIEVAVAAVDGVESAGPEVVVVGAAAVLGLANEALLPFGTVAVLGRTLGGGSDFRFSLAGLLLSGLMGLGVDMSVPVEGSSLLTSFFMKPLRVKDLCRVERSSAGGASLLIRLNLLLLSLRTWRSGVCWMLLAVTVGVREIGRAGRGGSSGEEVMGSLAVEGSVMRVAPLERADVWACSADVVRCRRRVLARRSWSSMSWSFVDWSCARDCWRSAFSCSAFTRASSASDLALESSVILRSCSVRVELR